MERRRLRKEKKLQAQGGTAPNQPGASGSGDCQDDGTGQSSPKRTGGNSNPNQIDTESDYDSEDDTDSEEELDDEAKKVREQRIQEMKETKIREARKILFGDFAVL